MMRLFLLGFLLSACASGRLKYMNTNGHTTGKKHDTEVTIGQPGTEPSTDTEVTIAEPEASITAKETIPAEEETKVADRLLDQLKEKDPETYEQVHSLYSRIDKKPSSEGTEEDEEKRTTGNILLILALILGLLSILFIFKSDSVSTADSSPEGCIFALASMAVYMMFAILFGIAAIVLLVIGLIIIAVSRSERNQSSQ